MYIRLTQKIEELFTNKTAPLISHGVEYNGKRFISYMKKKINRHISVN